MKTFNSKEQFLQALAEGTYSEDRNKIMLQSMAEVRSIERALGKKFPDAEIEYTYEPNKQCNDRGFEWTETMHYFSVMIPLEKPYCKYMTFNLIVDEKKTMNRVLDLINKAKEEETVDFEGIAIGSITNVLEEMGFELNEERTVSSFFCSELTITYSRGKEFFEFYVFVPTFECSLTYGIDEED